MNALAVCGILSAVIYALLFNFTLVKIFLIFGGLYGVCSWIFVGLSASKYNNARRKIMICTWSDPVGPEIYGCIKMNFENAAKFLNELQEKTGKHITYVHLVLKTIGEMLKEFPDLNGRLTQGCYAPNSSIDVSFMVPVDERNISYPICIKSIDQKNLAEISEEVEKGVKEAQNKKEIALLKYVPTCFRGVLCEIRAWLTVSLGLHIPFLGSLSYPSGHCLVSDISYTELDTIYLPFTPSLRSPVSFVINSVKPEPCVINGAPAVQSFLTLTGTIDHRYLDGVRAAKAQNKIKEILENPANFFKLD
ncbi:unnamed protein product [Blepharisma stoltei]|uniref:2-oxoacid dehydrogenase acyltransferase catalytic domain-containing protein n=1 Tax=Blepharisma stoltei TaxID=1481888 RepID=A0AAU9JVW6_9CILI|nr:unnamed protein product [Blepharisma stoltei]